MLQLFKNFVWPRSANEVGLAIGLISPHLIKSTTRYGAKEEIEMMKGHVKLQYYKLCNYIIYEHGLVKNNSSNHINAEVDDTKDLPSL